LEFTTWRCKYISKVSKCGTAAVETSKSFYLFAGENADYHASRQKVIIEPGDVNMLEEPPGF
jgi:hypothetical protein